MIPVVLQRVFLGIHCSHYLSVLSVFFLKDNCNQTLMHFYQTRKHPNLTISHEAGS